MSRPESITLTIRIGQVQGCCNTLKTHVDSTSQGVTPPSTNQEWLHAIHAIVPSPPPPNLRDDSCSLKSVNCSLNSVNATSKPSSYVTRIREGVLREEVERPLRERGLPRFHQ